MKKSIYKLLGILSIAFLATACLDDNLQPEGEWELTEATAIYPTADETIVLNQNTPNETISFQWGAATSSENYSVRYSVLIDSINANDLSRPLLEVQSNNNGNGLGADITYQQIDQALSIGGFQANETASVVWSVKATSLSKNSFATQPVSFVRFETETLPTSLFISGSATENNNVLENAIRMKRMTNEQGELSGVFEVYSSLNEGASFKFYSNASVQSQQFGGSNGVLERFGSEIEVQESGTYRIKADLENDTYELLKIENWSIVGDVIPVGWGGDFPLTYEGGGIWKASVNLVDTGGFAFRANEDWDLLLKRIVGTQLNLALEADAASQGVVVEDIPSNQLGRYVVTLNLSANGYTYLFELDTTQPDPLDAPEQLFLLSNNEVVKEFTKNNDQFTSADFIPLQSGNEYFLNSEADGSGTSYSIAGGVLAQSTTPDGDMVSDTSILVESDAAFTLSSDRSLRLNFDFGAASLNWTYYNFKLFHWVEWEDRDEFQMTYQHPNTYIITIDLEAGYNMKFISPWDFDMGSTSPTSSTGEIINGGGENLVNISTSGTYSVEINLSSDFQTGTYSFESN
jgi:hypothetical protein